MSTIIDLTDNDLSKLKNVSESVKNGEIIIFPTDTVYGIGTNGLNEASVKKVYEIKNRNENNPINLLVSDIKMIKTLTQNVSELEYKLMNAFFPGPFTIILPKNSAVPDIITAGLDSVGVRIPNNDIAIEIIKKAGVPIAAPSANISGLISNTDISHICEEFDNTVNYIIDGGSCPVGIESTIVKVIDNIPHILRPGSITFEQIEEVSGVIPIKDYETNSTNIPSSDLSHYKAKTKTILVFGNDKKMLKSKLEEIANTYTKPILITNFDNFEDTCALILDYGKTPEEIAKNIFSLIKEADSYDGDVIIIQGLPKTGICEAIMDRLLKTAGENYIDIDKLFDMKPKFYPVI